jgi:hypothetical protein
MNMHGSLNSNIKSSKLLDAVNEYFSYLQHERGEVFDYENTYRLEPTLKFNANKVEGLCRAWLRKFIENMFDSEALKSSSSSMAISQHLTTMIKNRVKALCDKRYRVITYSVIGEMNYQDVIVASKLFLNSETDHAISVKDFYKNYFVIVNVYVIYKD